MGAIHGVGVGPGDPELLTLKAARLIAEADVVSYPRADDAPSFAREIVADRLAHVIEEPIVVPMRTDRHPASAVYDDAAKRLLAHASAGRNVVVLCEGDPFFYGSFMYLFARLSGEARVGVVPGVSSIMAAAAAIPRPLASRNDTLQVLSAVRSDDALEAALRGGEAAAIIKLGRHLPRLRALLDAMGLLDRTYYCERIGTSRGRTVRLDRMRGEEAPYFSLLLVYRGDEPAILGKART